MHHLYIYLCLHRAQVRDYSKLVRNQGCFAHVNVIVKVVVSEDDVPCRSRNT